MSNQVITLESPVPFGKYKDQPVAVMMGDQQYVNWCLMQTWFAEKHAALAAILQGRNTLEQDACTPEHNSLQMLFLRPEYQTGLRRALYPDSDKYLALATMRKKDLNDALRHPDCYAKADLALYQKEVDMLEECCHQPAANAKFDASIEFEANNWDILITGIVPKGNCVCGEAIQTVNVCRAEKISFWQVEAPCIELKPSISEDYPAILRKVKSRMGYLHERNDIGRKVVITREITAATATVEEIKAMFKMSGVELFLLSEIEELI